MPNRLGITPEDEGDVVGSAMPQFGHFDGGVAPSVLLRQRVIEGLHGPFDLFVVLHGNTSLPAWCGYHTTTLQGVCPLHLKKSGSYFVSNPKRSGKPCIRGLRITVIDVLEYLASGMREDELLADFPDLEHEDIRACLAFAAERERHRAL